jgi:hypothetical protein
MTQYTFELYRHDDADAWYFETYAAPSLDLDDPVYVSRFFKTKAQARAAAKEWIALVKAGLPAF